MTEAEWLAFPDTRKVKRFLGCSLSPRKCLLAVCAYGFQIAEYSSVPPLLGYLREWEGKADAVPLVTVTINEIHRQCNAIVVGHQVNTPPHSICSALGYLIQAAVDRGSIGQVTARGLRISVAQAKCPGVRFNLQRVENSDPIALAAYTSETATFNSIVLDTLGSPFRPVVFDPAWRTFDATALACGMYETRDFSAMPILADALQDAGCDNAEILDHCRDEGQVHVRGCWVVDGVLAKS